jgi:chloramphenicol O-acetyltransferase
MLLLSLVIKICNFYENVQIKCTTVTFKLSYMILLDHGKIKGLTFSSVFLFILMNSNSVTFYRLLIPDHRLPTTEHPTVLSVIQSENDTVVNVLVDQV